MTDWMWAGAGLAFVAPFFSQLRNAVGLARSVLVCSVTLKGSVGEKAARYLMTNARSASFGDRTFASYHYWVRPLNHYADVVFEMFSNRPRFIWYRMSPMLVTHKLDKDTNIDVLTLVYVRGTFDLNALLDSVSSMMCARPNRFSVLHRHGRLGESQIGGIPVATTKESAHVAGTPLFYDWEELGSPTATRELALTEEQLDMCVEFDRWISSRDWFIERSLPWRRGWLLYGPPGTGKTVFAIDQARRAKIPVYQFDLSSMSNRDLKESWDEACQEAPSMVLVEDLDAVFNGRKNVASSAPGALTFDCLLNTIGGAAEANGVFLVITTNKVECLDEALAGVTATRPGRVDRVAYFGPATEGQRAAIVDRILAGHDEETRRQVVEETAGQSTASVVNRCTIIGLSSWSAQ